MKVFISWSGERSHQFAKLLCSFIHEVIQAVEPWTSQEIRKGDDWNSGINEKLRDSVLGIICLTRENLNERWLLFEAGALMFSRGGEKRLVCPILVDKKMKTKEVKSPLSQFQATKADKDGILGLVETLNGELDKNGFTPREKSDLRRVFDKWWPDFETDYAKIIENTPSEEQAPTRSEEDVIEEILENTRTMKRHMSSLISDKKKQSVLDKTKAPFYDSVTRSDLPLYRFIVRDDIRDLTGNGATLREIQQAVRSKFKDELSESEVNEIILGVLINPVRKSVVPNEFVNTLFKAFSPVGQKYKESDSPGGEINMDDNSQADEEKD